MNQARKIFVIAVLLGFAAVPVSATSLKAVKKGDSEFSVSIRFVQLTNTKYDSAFTQQIFTELVQDALARAQIVPDANNIRKNHLTFHVDYAYLPGDVGYRFAAFHAANRNAANHAICDDTATAWWGGPSGQSQIPKQVQESIDSFIKRCSGK